MKKIITSDITTGLRMPFTKDALNHVQNAYKEIVNDVVLPFIQDPTKVTILHGGVFKELGTPASVYYGVSGSAFYNGEVYKFDEPVLFTGTTATTGVWVVETTYPSELGNPLKFYDASNPAGTNKNVLQVNKLKFQAGSPGSGICDFEDTLKIPSIYGFAKKAQEDWHFVGESGEIPFQNGWSNRFTSSYLTKFRKDDLGNVSIKGCISYNTTGTFFTMPVGYRPSTTLTHMLVAAYNNVGAGNTLLILNVGTDGAVSISAVLGTTFTEYRILLDINYNVGE